MWIFYTDLLLALGVPALGRLLGWTTTRQAIALAAALWALAQPEDFGIAVGNLVSGSNAFSTFEVLAAGIGGLGAIITGLWAAFSPPAINYQRLLYLAACVAACFAAVIWTHFLPGLLVSIAAPCALLALAVSPRPYVYTPRIRHRIYRRRAG